MSSTIVSFILVALAAQATIVASASQSTPSSQPTASFSPICSQPRTSTVPSAQDLVSLLKPQVSSACQSLVQSSGTIASDLVEGYVFFGGPSTGSDSDCQQAFENILSQCVKKQNYFGGEVLVSDTQLYNLTNARGSLNPILSGSGAVQHTSSITISIPSAPQIPVQTSTDFSSNSQTSMQSSSGYSAGNTLGTFISQVSQSSPSTSATSQSQLSINTAQSTSVAQSTISAQSSGSILSSTATPSGTVPSSISGGDTSQSSLQSSASLPTGPNSALLSSTAPVITSLATSSSLGGLGGGGPGSATTTTKLSTTLPPVAVASATNEAKNAKAAVGAYSQNPTSENAKTAKTHIDDALAGAALLAAGTTGGLALAFGGLVSALMTAQTAAVAAVAAPGAATAATLASSMAAVDEALKKEEEAEKEQQQSTLNVSRPATSAQISSFSASITKAFSSTVSSTSSTSSCSASGTGSVCSSALIPVYSLDIDTFAHVQDVLNAAEISSRLAPLMAEETGATSQLSLSTTNTATTSIPTSNSIPISNSAASTSTVSSTTSTPTLNCQQNIPSDGPSPTDVANALTSSNGIATICAAKFDGSGDSTHMTFNHGSIDIEVIRSSATQTLSHCTDAMNSIIKTCILGSADYGGVYSQDGETYNITNTIAPANPLIPGTDPGAPSTTAPPPPPSSTTAPPSPPSSTAPVGPPAPTQISSNNKGSALCHSLAGACKVAYTGYNDTWLYTQYTSYPVNPGADDPINWIFMPFANDGCAAMFTCDNNDAYSVGMLGSQIKAAFENLFANDKVNECGSSYLSNSCHVTVNGCDNCKPSIPCGSLPPDAPSGFPCY